MGEVSIYLRQNLPKLFQRIVHFNPKVYSHKLQGYKKKKKFVYCSFLGDVHCIVISKAKA